MASSSSSSARVVIAMLLISVLGVASGNDLIFVACKMAGAPDTEFCKAALGSVGAGEHAKSYKELAAVAADLLVANATSTKAKIDGLLASGGGLQALRSCQALYEGIVDGGRGSAAAIRGSRFREATAGLEKAATAARRCEDGFGKSGAPPSPVTKEGRDADRLAELAVRLIGIA
ncbi:pectinesterase inhibitor 8 [Brachypodium distachyon]|uniref:pectinesterase inhibitor 8 n=1 Tax=Brachypodium distachyon TaxID=15368 RepID=UPI0001C712EF|nr:pectinesterase inhibitor 8 [Brachypodium distachyon]|eukprot:XP_010239313.1 pectinesterase inhibitor 8 [Brachypodium distachyon]